MSQFFLRILPLEHESVIFLACCVIAYCLFEEISTFRYYYKVNNKSKLSSSSESHPPILSPPSIGNINNKFDCHLDVLGSLKYMPNNGKIQEILKNEPDDITETPNLLSPTSTYSQSPTFSTTPSSLSQTPSTPSTNRLVSQVLSPIRFDNHALISTELETEIKDEISRLTSPLPSGCEYLGENFNILKKKFSQLTSIDIIRFLVARKGNVKLAEEMIEKYLTWKLMNFPINKKTVANSFKSKCFFPYGKSKDGSPIVVMRGCLYNSKLATPYEYVMAASLCIDWALANNKGQPSVTVLVHTSLVEGGPNEVADLQFIKLFIQVLSDNYPERLKRLAIYPFPFYGRMLWKILKVFLDKRTQEKIMLLNPGKNDKTGFPSELKEFIDLSEIPTYIGGTSTAPALDLLDTLDE